MPAKCRHLWFVSVLVIVACSCQSVRRPVQSVNLTSKSGKSILLRGAGNEWADFILHVNGLARVNAQNVQMRLVGLDRIGPDARWYHLDEKTSALVSLQAEAGTAVLSDVPPDGSVWIDLHIPASAPAGDYHGSMQFLVDAHPITEIPLSLHVYGFSLPDQPTLTIAGEVTSQGLRHLYNEHLPDSVQPLIQLCQENRLQLWFSDLQPMNHWPPDTEIWKDHSQQGDDQAAIRAFGLQAILDKNSTVLCRGAVSGAGDAGSWFYPGDEFGVAGPVESVLFKKFRDSEQDAEYFAITQHTQGAEQARAIANLLAVGSADSSDRLLPIPLDPASFAAGKEFLARLIDATNLSTRQQKQSNLQLIRWIAAHSRPQMRARATNWFWNPTKPGQLDLKLFVDIFNPSEISPNGNILQWAALPAGWESAAPVNLPSLPSHRITHALLTGSFDATQLHITTDAVSRLTFINGFDASTADLTVNLPVASCDRRAEAPIIDGSLTDWSTDDMVCNRSLSQQIPSPTEPPTQILSSFSDTHLFLAFRMEGVNSFHDRAEGQFVVQPIFADNSLGKTVIINCHPTGISESTPAGSVQYACTVASGIWRGELAVPWNVLVAANARIPSALRFNFIRRRRSYEIASWAGPVNSIDPLGSISGILVLRNAPGDLIK